jgi:hypothetical protein
MFRLYSYLKFNYEETLLVPHKPDLSLKMPFLTRRRKYKPASPTQTENEIFGARESFLEDEEFEIALEKHYGPTIPLGLSTAVAYPPSGFSNVPATTTIGSKTFSYSTLLSNS